MEKLERKKRIIIDFEKLSDKGRENYLDDSTLSSSNNLSLLILDDKIEYIFLQAIYGSNKTIIIFASHDEISFIHSIECSAIFGNERDQNLVKQELSEKKFIGGRNNIKASNLFLKETTTSVEIFLFNIRSIYHSGSSQSEFLLSISSNDDIFRKTSKDNNFIDESESPPDISNQGTGTYES